MQASDQTLIISPLETKSQAGSLVEFYTGSAQFIGFNNYQSSGGFGSMQFNHHAGSGFDIWYSAYQFIQKDKLTTRASIPVLELHIPFKGEFRSTWDGFEDTVFSHQMFNLSYLPFIHQVTQTHTGQSFETFDIHYSKDYLQRFAHYPLMAAFLEKVEKGQPAHLLTTAQFLSPSMIRLVNEVLQYNMHPAMAAHFYEASALMLLTMALDRITGNRKSVLYSAYDQECTTYVKELLLSDFSQRTPISTLARHSGINETKLQSCFKHLFGTTIFDYQQSARLDHARHLLRTTNLPIQSIAEACGYPDGSNLTIAFKKKFDCTPDYYRKFK